MCKKSILFVLMLGFCITSLVQAGNIIWVSGFFDGNIDGFPDDQEWVDRLRVAGYIVDYTPGWEELDDAKIVALNAADLIIVSRNTNSAYYDDGDEPTLWDSITTPMLVSSTHLMRSTRWRWMDSINILPLAPAVMELADGSQLQAMDETVGPSAFIDAAPGNGTVLATGDGLPWIVEWEAGVEYYDGSGQIAGGPRMFFVAGTQDSGGTIGRGEMNLTAEGLAVFMDAVDMLSPALSPTPEAKLAGTVLFIMDEVDSGNIAPELEGSLLVKIDAALAALDKGNPNAAKVAMNDLKALINQVEAQVEKKITSYAAEIIIDSANDLIAELGG